MQAPTFYDSKPFHFSPESAAEARRVIGFFPEGKQKSAILRLLHLAQDESVMASTLDRFAPGTNSGTRYRDFIRLIHESNLISPQARNVTGQTITIDGGWTAT